MRTSWTSKALAQYRLATLAGMLGTLGMASLAVHAQTIIALPAQALSLSLSQLAREGAVNILAPSELTANHNAPALSGKLTISEALHRLLEGTQLTVQQRDEKTYIIHGPPAQAEAATPRPSDIVTVLPPVTVSGTSAMGDLGFAAQSSSLATRTDTPIIQIPQSIAVVTQDTLASQQDQSVRDVLRNVSSITIDRVGSYSAQGMPYIRGYAAPVLLNGLPVAFSQTDIPMSLPAVAVSRVEVLKGADSILAGSMDAGGLVNIVTKRPQADPVQRLTVQAGSYGDWLTSLDLAGAITDDKKLTYRFVMSGERAGQDSIGYDGKRNFYVAPSIGWHDAQTTLVVGLEQNSDREPFAPNSLLLPTGPMQLSSPLGRPDDRYMINDTAVYYDYTRKLTSSLTFHSKARYDASSQDSREYLIMGLTSGGGIFLPQTNQIQQDQVSVDNNLQFKTRTGPITHTLLAGFAWSLGRYAWTLGSGTSITTPIPVPPLPPVAISSVNKIPVQRDSLTTLYVQDQMAWGPLHVLVNLGRSQVWTTHDAAGIPSERAVNWSPSIGIAYQLTDSFALFANTTHSFLPQYTFPTFKGSIPQPRIGHSIDAGVKFSLLDDHLTGTVALFRSKESNAVQSDFNHPGFYAVVPDIAYRGVELEVTGRLLPGWNVIASYTYSNAQAPNGEVGQLPAHVASLWTTYDFQNAFLHGWGAGIGVWARSHYNAVDASENLYPQSGQTRTDVSVYYHAKHWSATLSAKNIFNRALYDDYADQRLEQQSGRLFYLSGTYDF